MVGVTDRPHIFDQPGNGAQRMVEGFVGHPVFPVFVKLILDQDDQVFSLIGQLDRVHVWALFGIPPNSL